MNYRAPQGVIAFLFFLSFFFFFTKVCKKVQLRSSEQSLQPLRQDNNVQPERETNEAEMKYAGCFQIRMLWKHRSRNI